VGRTEHPYISLARYAIRYRQETGRAISIPAEDDDPPVTGVFVSLHEPATGNRSEGALRGCIGSIEPRERTLRTEIARSAVAAAFADPRFPPLTSEEIDRLAITVYILGEPELVADESELDPKRYGVIVEGGGRRGVLLPGIPRIDSIDTQVKIARQKAGINPSEPARLFRFTADILT
jgi:AmmeMemoRadiSam system protein A